MVNQYDRYRQDAEVLAAIGAALRGQDDPAQAVIPMDLRIRALSAWQRDEQEPIRGETADQQRLRAQAGTLALIGLCVEQAEGSEYVVLQPDTFAEALNAVDR